MLHMMFVTSRRSDIPDTPPLPDIPDTPPLPDIPDTPPAGVHSSSGNREGKQ